MAALVCDICGGKLIMGAGGIAICDSCGMEHSADRMKEKVQEIKGTVRVDNSHMIENYFEMAKSASIAGNYTEAEMYCNKIIEIEPINYKAWMLKGESAAWQSTLKNFRIDEGISCFIKAIDNAPEEEKEELIENIKNEIIKLSTAILTLRAERFAKWPDEEEANGFITDITSIARTVSNFLMQTNVVVPFEKLFAPIATLINQSVVKAWEEVIWPEYNGDSSDPDWKPGKYEWQTYIDRIRYCTDLLEKAIDLCDEDGEEDIIRYKNLIYFHKNAINSCSWTYKYTDWGKRWYEEWALTDEAKRLRYQKISRYEDKIKELEAAKAAKEAAERKEKERIAKEEAQMRFNEYWAEHAEEKENLEKERADLNEQISEFNQEIKRIVGEEEIKQWQDIISHLIAEKSSLGLFKGKEKKAIQLKIDDANVELKKVQDRMTAEKEEIQQKITPLQNRVNDITTELTKAR